MENIPSLQIKAVLFQFKDNCLPLFTSKLPELACFFLLWLVFSKYILMYLDFYHKFILNNILRRENGGSKGEETPVKKMLLKEVKTIMVIPTEAADLS